MCLRVRIPSNWSSFTTIIIEYIWIRRWYSVSVLHKSFTCFLINWIFTNFKLIIRITCSIAEITNFWWSECGIGAWLVVQSEREWLNCNSIWKHAKDDKVILISIFILASSQRANSDNMVDGVCSDLDIFKSCGVIIDDWVCPKKVICATRRVFDFEWHKGHCTSLSIEISTDRALRQVPSANLWNPSIISWTPWVINPLYSI